MAPSPTIPTTRHSSTSWALVWSNSIPRWPEQAAGRSASGEMIYNDNDAFGGRGPKACSSPFVVSGPSYVCFDGGNHMIGSISPSNVTNGNAATFAITASFGFPGVSSMVLEFTVRAELWRIDRHWKQHRGRSAAEPGAEHHHAEAVQHGRAHQQSRRRQLWHSTLPGTVVRSHARVFSAPSAGSQYAADHRII